MSGAGSALLAGLLVTTSGGASAVSGSGGTLVPRPFVLSSGLGVRVGHIAAGPAAASTPLLTQATPHGTPVPLNVEPELENAFRSGEELILNRRYGEALALFESVSGSHPGSPLGPLGKMLVYQSQMLENGDYAEEKEYEAAIGECGRRIAEERKNPDPRREAWQTMLAAGFHGIQGMHAMRKKRYLEAVDEGWSALSSIKELHRMEPDLADTGLGLGTYDYWRSVVTKSVSWLPFFPDKRKSGIAQIERSFVDAQYVRPIAELVLVFIYIDEHQYPQAIELGEDMAKRFPGNTLVRVQLGRAYSRAGRYDDAIRIYQEVEKLQPDNKLVDYYLGANLLYQGADLDQADRRLRRFLANAPGDDWRGWANERLGDVFMKRGKPEIALTYYYKAKKDIPDDEELAHKLEQLKHRQIPTVTPTPGKGMGSLP